jgi:hypothetical protein
MRWADLGPTPGKQRSAVISSSTKGLNDIVDPYWHLVTNQTPSFLYFYSMSLKLSIKQKAAG